MDAVVKDDESGDEAEEIVWTHNTPYNNDVYASCCPGAGEGFQVLFRQDFYRFQALRHGEASLRKVRLVRAMILPNAEDKTFEYPATFPSITQLFLCHRARALQKCGHEITMGRPEGRWVLPEQ